MNKREIYFRWAVSLCLLACVVGYQLTRPAAEQTVVTAVRPSSVAESSAAVSASSESAAASEPDSAAASSEVDSEAASEEAAESEEAASEEASETSSEAAASTEKSASSASSESSSAAAPSKAESTKAASSKAETAPAPTPDPEPAPAPEPATPRGPYADGVYSGSGKGFGGKVYVNVTVQSGYIAAVDVTSADGEDKPYLRDAMQIINSVIATQSTKLDAISGATSTTWGILDAIDDALKGA